MLYLSEMKRSLFIGLLALCGAAFAWADATNHISVEELRQARLPNVTLESVTQATPGTEKKPNAASYLEVKGIIGEHIRFELLLPDTWNRRATALIEVSNERSLVSIERASPI